MDSSLLDAVHPDPVFAFFGQFPFLSSSLITAVHYRPKFSQPSSYQTL